MKRRSSKRTKKAAARKRGGQRQNVWSLLGAPVPPVVGTMLDIIEEVTFAFGTDAAAAESDERPTLKKLNHHDQL